MYTTRYALVLTNIGQNFDENKLTFDETKKMNFWRRNEFWTKKWILGEKINFNIGQNFDENKLTFGETNKNKFLTKQKKWIFDEEMNFERKNEFLTKKWILNEKMNFGWKN